MRIKINKSTKKEEWILDKWYNKFVFLVGILEMFIIIVTIFRNSL